MRSAIFLVLACLASGCAGNDQLTIEEEMPSVLPANYFEAQQSCVGAWREILLQWHAGGGHVYATIDETRLHIERDHKSVLAAIFNEVWEAQRAASRDDAGALFASAAKGYVPTHCGAYSWLGELLPTLEGLMTEDVKADLRSQSTRDFVDNDPSLGVWVVGEMLGLRNK